MTQHQGPRSLRLNESRHEIDEITSQLGDITLQQEGRDLIELKERYKRMTRSTPTTEEGDPINTTVRQAQDETTMDINTQPSTWANGR